MSTSSTPSSPSKTFQTSDPPSPSSLSTSPTLPDVDDEEDVLEAPAFYTPSMMIGSMNDTMKGVGGSVELKRKLDDGTLISSTEKEREAADMSAKMRQSAEEVKGMTFGEKVEWSGVRRGVGNELYKRGEYKEAMDVYMTALCGISNEEGDRVESERDVSLPVLLNLAQCAIKLRMAGKAIQFCDHATKLSTGVGEGNFKVLYRRGKARVMRGDFEGARKDFEDCRDACDKKGAGEGERKALEVEVEKLERLVRKGRKDEGNGGWPTSAADGPVPPNTSRDSRSTA